MGKTIMGAVVSLDGFIADDNDDVGPLFDWYGNGDVTWSFPGSDGESRSTQASADFMRNCPRPATQRGRSARRSSPLPRRPPQSRSNQEPMASNRRRSTTLGG
jgi:hypothetical protein